MVYLEYGDTIKNNDLVLFILRWKDIWEMLISKKKKKPKTQTKKQVTKQH